MLEKYLRRPEVEVITGLSTTSIYRMMQRGEFPKPVKITAKSVAWPESCIEEWQQERTRRSA